MSKPPWEARSGRRQAVRQIQRHLIVCEDEKSAADYLGSFKVPKEFAEVVVEGGAGNTLSVVEKALELREKAIRDRKPYAQVWCVFDRDEFPPRRFKGAFELARSVDRAEVRVIWSNECFELWYLLHFEFVVAGIGRHELFAKLREPTRFGKKYDKADTSVFELLIDRVETAKKHARKLLDDYGRALDPEKHNPSTNVHELVIVLQRLGQLGD